MSVQASDVRVHDVRLRVQRSGKGPTLLFLHGAGGASRWLPFFERLAADFEVVVPDHPGFGQSDDPEWIRNVPDIAMLYLELFEHLGLERVALVGHSIGGWIAAEIAVRDCSRIGSLTLLAPAGIRLKGVPPGDAFIWNAEEAVRNLYADQRFADEQLAQPPAGEEIDRLLKNRFSFAKLAWQPRLFNPDLEKWLRRVKVPSQVIWGDSDKIIPPQYAALWQERLPDARVECLSQCGHLPHVERADEVAQIVKSFAKGGRA